MVEQDEVHGDVGGHVMMVIKLRDLEKKKEKNKKGLKAKVISIGPFCFGDQVTIESVITFRIDSCTIKREALIGQLDHLVPLGVEILALHFRPSAHSVRK